MHTETVFVDEHNHTNEHVASSSYPLKTYWKSTESVAGKGVRIRDPRAARERVDILIYLPQIDLQWLDEWSDLDASSVFNISAANRS